MPYLVILNRFNGAILYGRDALTLKTVVEEAVGAGVDLRGADLSNQDLRGANLMNARLDEADLTGSKFAGAQLDNATLRQVDAGNSDIAGAVTTTTDQTGLSTDPTPDVGSSESVPNTDQIEAR